MLARPHEAPAIVLLFCLATGCGGAPPPEPPAGAVNPEPPPTTAATAAPKPEPSAAAAGSTSVSSGIVSSTPAASAASPPVAGGALKGKINGKPFMPKSALAVVDPGDKDKKKVTIYDQRVDCKRRDKLEGKGRRAVAIRVPWAANATAELDAFAATILVDQKDAPLQIGNLGGRAELGDAPTKVGTKGKIKVRVTDQAGENKVEGEVQFTVCE